MNESTEIRNGQTEKWLQIMVYIGIASIVNSLMAVIPSFPGVVSTWVSRGIMAAMICCTYMLSSAGERYKRAAMYWAVMLGCTLAAAFLFRSSALNLVASIFSIMAVYQEYSAHAELIEEQDPKLAGKWHGLFYWGFVAGILISFGTMIAAVLAAVAKMDIAKTTAVIVAVLGVPQLVIEVIYLRYLMRTVRLLKESRQN